MGWTSTIEDIVNRLNDDQHRLSGDTYGQSPEMQGETRRLHEECCRMLSKIEAVRKELGDPTIDPAARLLDSKVLLEQKNEKIARLSAELDKERERRQKADSECGEAKKKIANMNGRAAMYGEGSGLVRSLQGRVSKLSKQKRDLWAKVIQLEGKRKARKRGQAQERRQKKMTSATTVVVETKGRRASREPRP